MRGVKTWQQPGISPEEAKIIQNAADRTKQTIIVVGSRANETSTPTSDSDYIMLGNSQRHSACSSVPRGTSRGEINSSGPETGIDIFTSSLNSGEPHVIFEPDLGEVNESN